MNLNSFLTLAIIQLKKKQHFEIIPTPELWKRLSHVSKEKFPVHLTVQTPFPNKRAISAPYPGSQASRPPDRTGPKDRNPFTTQLNRLADTLR